jgi:hypothetical protein
VGVVEKAYGGAAARQMAGEELVAYRGGVKTPPRNSEVLTKLSQNSLKVPNIKKILLYEMKFLVQNYCCLQNH